MNRINIDRISNQVNMIEQQTNKQTTISFSLFTLSCLQQISKNEIDYIVQAARIIISCCENEAKKNEEEEEEEYFLNHITLSLLAIIIIIR